VPAFELVGTILEQNLGIALGRIGDVDGDGYADFVTSGTRGPMLVASGIKGSIIYEDPDHTEAAGDLGDVTGDGIDDFVVGRENFGKISIIEGRTFSVVREISRPLPVRAFGKSIAVLEDVDGDSHRDFAVGAPGFGSPHEAGSGDLFVFSGATGAQLYHLVGEAIGADLGQAIVAPGDLNGDRIGDLVVSSPGCCGLDAKDPGPGRVYFLDGVTGASLGFIDAVRPSRAFGLVMNEAGDVNGNGYGDVLASINDLDNRRRNAVWVIDGGSHEVLFELPDSQAFASAEDWNHDGFPDVLLGHPLRATNVYSGAPRGVEAVGEPCSQARGAAPRIGASGVPRIGVRYPVHLSQVVPDRVARLFIGRRLKRTAPNPGSPGCSLLVDPVAVLSRQTQQLRPGEGAATVKLPIPNDSSLIGEVFYAQWAILDGTGQLASFTRALRFTIAATP
jgi:hypothetical protein